MEQIVPDYTTASSEAFLVYCPSLCLFFTFNDVYIPYFLSAYSFEQNIYSRNYPFDFFQIVQTARATTL